MRTVIALESPSARSVSQVGLVDPGKRRNEVRRAFKGNPSGAGRFWPIAALLVGHNRLALLPPRALHWAKIGSVTVCIAGRDWV